MGQQMPWGSQSGHKHSVAHCPARPQVSGREIRLGHGRQSQEYWQMHWDFDIWQGVGRGLALAAAPLCRALHVQPHAYPSRTAVAQAMFVTRGVCPWAGYLMFLSLDFLTIEVAVRTQRAWCVGLKLGASGRQWVQSQLWETLGEDFLPKKLHTRYVTPKLFLSLFPHSFPWVALNE